MRAIGVLIALSAVLSACCGDTKYRMECEGWRNATTMMNHKNGSMMTCKRNVQCTGYDCNGLYEYQGIYSMGEEVHFNYCFGMAIHPCHRPVVDLSVYLDLREHDIHLQRNVVNSTDFEVPGFHFELGKLGMIDGFIHVDMTRKTIRGHRYAEVGMQFKVRVQGTIAIVGEWPESLQQTLMPKTDVPIPPCERDVITPRHDPASCGDYVAPKTTSPKSNISTISTTVVYPNYTGSMRKACVPNLAYECGDFMMCEKTDKVCVCLSDYWFNGSACVPQNHIIKTTTPFFIPAPADATIVATTSGKGRNWTPIIIGVSVGSVVVLICIIGGTLLYKYKRHQARYGDHQLLNNQEEDDDDDDPIDVTT